MLKNYPKLELEVVSNVTKLPVLPKDAILLSMGKEPLEVLASLNLIPKNRTVTSLRGQVFALHNNSKLLVTYSPAIYLVDHSNYVDLLCDMNSAIRLKTTGKLEPVYGKYEWVADLHKFREQVEAIHAGGPVPVSVAVDLETVGLDPYLKPTLHHPGAYIVSIQMSHSAGTGQAIHFPTAKAEREWLADPKTVDDLVWLLNTPKVSIRGANFKYDLKWLWVRGKLECTNFRMDTTLVGSLLDENRSNALDVHTKFYVPSLGGYSDEFDRTVEKSRMDLVPKTTLLPYACGDVDACLQVAEAEKNELCDDPQLASFYVNILHPAARAFEIVERGGIFVDRGEYELLETDLQTEVNRLVVKAKEVLGGRIWAKHNDQSKAGGMNLTKPSMLIDFMFSPMGLNLTPKMFTAKSTKEDRTPSTALEHLMMFKGEPEAAEFISLLSDYAGATKTLGTYVHGFLKHLRSDGRYHPSYFFFAGNKDEGEGGTNTGRLSCKDPAFQTLSKHTKWAKRLRKCYIAPPGYLVAERDYSQGELRVVACIANERNMIKAYQSGMDLHAVTSGRFAGYSYEEMMLLKEKDKEVYAALRQLGKAGNFGLLYGMGAEGFLNYAVDSYGVKDFTMEDATKFRNGFFETYPDLVTYHKEYKESASENGYVRSPLGRIRHLPLIKSTLREIASKAERQAINAPVQCTLSDLLLWVIAIEHEMKRDVIAPCFGANHDAAYNYIPEDSWEDNVVVMREVMENLPFEKIDWKPQLKFYADIKVGSSMADLVEVK